MAPKPHSNYDDGDDEVTLYIAHDQTQNNAHVIKFGITRLEPRKRLQAIKGGFRALLREAENDSRATKEIIRCFGAHENWVIDRAWRFNSGEAAREAEKLCVALALRNRGTRPLGNDYVSGLKYEEAEKAVKWAINRVRQSTPPGRFKVSVKSARRITRHGVSNGGKLANAPDKPSFD